MSVVFAWFLAQALVVFLAVAINSQHFLVAVSTVLFVGCLIHTVRLARRIPE